MPHGFEHYCGRKLGPWSARSIDALETPHEPAPSNVADPPLAIFLEHRKQIAHRALQIGATLHEFVLSHLPYRREACRTGRRVSEERTGMNRFTLRRWPTIHHVCLRNASRERKAGGESFSDTDDVGNDTRMLARKPAPRATKPRKDLIEYEQESPLVAEFAQLLEPTVARRNFAAAALHWLNDNCSNIAPSPAVEDLSDGIKTGDLA